MLVTAGGKAHATGDDAVRFRDSFRLLEDDDEDQTSSQSAADPSAQ
jgi:hypothetical protein